MQKVLDQLNGELKGLERELRIELPREIKAALALGDLKENAEYHAALERQAYVKARIGQLRGRLSELGSVNMDRIPHDKVSLGSRVELLDLDTDEEIRYELVVPELAESRDGLISVASPIGKGLMGRKVGDEVSIQIPSGTKKYEILDLSTVHDRA
jgi:transcription elongation factor GreA